MQKDTCRGRDCQIPRWMKLTLMSAGGMGVLLALWTICWTEHWFTCSGMNADAYREMWMTVGMLNGVLGIGLLIASSNPLRHWTNLLIATIAKFASCIGFTWAVTRGVFPLSVGWVILFNDLIWLFPFSLILWKTVETYAGKSPLRETPYSLQEALESYALSSGSSLLEASQEKTVTIVFLRHFGCTFTRQLLKKLDELKKEASANGSKLVLVHMLQTGEEKAYLQSEDIERVSDPYCELYRAFGLGKGGVLELFGPSVILQGVLALFKGCGVGHLAGDGLQLPGAFLLKDGRIISAQRAKTAAELPQLEKLFDTSSVAA